MPWAISIPSKDVWQSGAQKAAKVLAVPHFAHVAVTPFSPEVQAIDASGHLFDFLSIEK